MAAIKDEFDSIPDSELTETFLERIEGLGEAVPEGVKKFVTKTCGWTYWGAKGMFDLTRNAVWIVSTTSLIAFMPYIIQKEIGDLEKSQVAAQAQMLLGPSAAIQQAKTQ